MKRLMNLCFHGIEVALFTNKDPVEPLQEESAYGFLCYSDSDFFVRVHLFGEFRHGCVGAFSLRG